MYMTVLGLSYLLKSYPPDEGWTRGVEVESRTNNSLSVTLTKIAES